MMLMENQPFVFCMVVSSGKDVTPELIIDIMKRKGNWISPPKSVGMVNIANGVEISFRTRTSNQKSVYDTICYIEVIIKEEMPGLQIIKKILRPIDDAERIQKICPFCGRQMIIREETINGTRFWGCSGYSSGACYHTEKIDYFHTAYVSDCQYRQRYCLKNNADRSVLKGVPAGTQGE